MTMKKKLFLADLSYVKPGREWTIIPFPLNVGYVASFLIKMLPNSFDVRIFKDPVKLLTAIEKDKPDVVAF